MSKLVCVVAGDRLRIREEGVEDSGQNRGVGS